jgi:hypothetical protein
MPSTLRKHIPLVVELFRKQFKKYLLLALRPLSWTIQGMVGFGQKIFLEFGFLIHVEHEKCSEICVWIVRFGQNLRKLEYL